MEIASAAIGQMYGCVTTGIWPPLSEVGGGGESCCFSMN
ncbi:MAG: hypothetical protein JWQ66_2327 [Mucilaginibacter sp.]|nr:hypothetical protein [Mucilaginibacter sp.]